MAMPAAREPRNILLVDDDLSVRQSVRLLLSIDRHAVTEATNGQEALALFTASKYDLVITDYLMPGMSGDELARNIRHIAPEQPILMITGHAEQLLHDEIDVDGILRKPISVDDLRRALWPK